MFGMSSTWEAHVTTAATDEPTTATAAPLRLVIAAPRLDHPDLVRVLEAWCDLGPTETAALVVATTDDPEEVAPVLLQGCAHLDLGAAGPIDLVDVDEVTALSPGELGLFLGGQDAAANLQACLDWIAARRPAGAVPTLDVSSIAAAIAAATPAAPAPADGVVVSAPTTTSFRRQAPTPAAGAAVSSAAPAPAPAPPAPAPAPRRPEPKAARRRTAPPPLAVVLGHPDDPAERVAHLEREVGRDRQVPRRLGAPHGVDALARVADVCRPLDWIDGYLSLGDAQFLYDVVAAVRPTRIVEIGSASGYSAAVMLRALADTQVPLVAADGRPAILSFDIATECYWDRSHRVGSAVGELVPDLVGGAEFVQGTSIAASALAPASASLAFIDANHDHPWATLDLLLLSRVLRPGSWVVLHDTRLALCGRLYADKTGTGAVWNQNGAAHLFETWQYERLAERTTPGTNIGAVRLPVDRLLGIADVHDSLARGWETRVPDEVLAAVRALG